MRDRILTTEQVSEEFAVPAATVRAWAMRGLLANAGAPGLYRESEVAETEFRTRRARRLVRLLESAAGQIR